MRRDRPLETADRDDFHQTRETCSMATKLSIKPDGAQGRFSTAPTLAIARQISSNDSASAASAACYRYESRVRELYSRFENELQAVRDAYLQELAGLDLTDQ
jgi:hypothetical protein